MRVMNEKSLSSNWMFETITYTFSKQDKIFIELYKGKLSVAKRFILCMSDKIENFQGKLKLPTISLLDRSVTIFALAKHYKQLQLPNHSIQ